MMPLDGLPRLLDAFRRDEDGSAAAEVAISVSILLSLAVAAADLGAILRADTALEAAVRDTARIVSLTPTENDGQPMQKGVEMAEAELRRRLASAGLSPVAMERPPGAVCSDDGAFCARVDPLPGSAAALGGPRGVVTVWASALAQTQFVDVFVNRKSPPGTVLMSSTLSQMHYR